MDNIGLFRDYLRKFIDLTDAEFDQLLMPVIKVRKFTKKELLTKAGNVEEHFNFIIKGLIRKY